MFQVRQFFLICYGRTIDRLTKKNMSQLLQIMTEKGQEQICLRMVPARALQIVISNLVPGLNVPEA